MMDFMSFENFGMGFMSFGWIGSLVWLVVGIFAAIWLWQHIKK